VTDATGTTFTPTGGSVGTDVLLDSGTTLVLLPSDLAPAIYNLVGASLDQSGSPVIDCSASTSPVIFHFQFTGIMINVAMSQMVLQLGGLPAGICGFGIASSSNLFPILGDTFLASTYVVHDLDNEQVAIAPTNPFSTSQNILPILAGPNGVPHSPGVPPPSSSSSSRTTTPTPVPTPKCNASMFLIATPTSPHPHTFPLQNSPF
jgi:hypothetical protein